MTSYQQNPNKCIVQEDVHNYIRCICRCINHDKVCIDIGVALYV